MLGCWPLSLWVFRRTGRPAIECPRSQTFSTALLGGGSAGTWYRGVVKLVGEVRFALEGTPDHDKSKVCSPRMAPDTMPSFQPQ